MALDFGTTLFFVGVLVAAVGPVAVYSVRTKDSTVWFNPFKFLKRLGKPELVVHLVGLALALAGVYLVYRPQ